MDKDQRHQEMAKGCDGVADLWLWQPCDVRAVGLCSTVTPGMPARGWPCSVMPKEWSQSGAHRVYCPLE